MSLQRRGGRSWQCGFGDKPPLRRRPAADSGFIPSIGSVVVVGKNTSFSLDEHFSAFIDAEVSSGRYRSASDVVRSALRLLEDRETRLAALRQALGDGERSGPSAPFAFDSFLAGKRGAEPDRR